MYVCVCTGTTHSYTTHVLLFKSLLCVHMCVHTYVVAKIDQKLLQLQLYIQKYPGTKMFDCFIYIPVFIYILVHVLYIYYDLLSSTLPRLARVPVLLTKPRTLSNGGIMSMARNSAVSVTVAGSLCNVCKMPAKSNCNNRAWLCTIKLSSENNMSHCQQK